MKNKYEVIGVVGEGAYGIVYKCRNKETNKYVAVKKFKETEDKLVQKTMKRELAMLQKLSHENVVQFQESFIHKGDFFLVFEYVEKNLLEVLEESPKGLNPQLIRSFVYQMCKAVSYLHKNNMIHRDVKPENLLIDEKLNLKLCDFGFARKIKLNQENNNIDTMTDYVATRWYRSPELLLSGGIYGPEVDYWAIGCIMGELADGNPMFPGENEVDQLDCIIKILGNLPENLINMYYENPIYNEKELFKVKKPETLERRYLGVLSPTAIDFMKGLLEMDPNKRLNGETVFKHKYFSIFMDNKEEKTKTITNNVNEIKETNMNTIKNNNNINNNKEIDIIKKKENNNGSEISNRNNNTLKHSKTMTKKLINLNNKKETDSKLTTIPSNVINNTTNINIINYNCYNNAPNINDFSLPKKLLDMNHTQKNMVKNLSNIDNTINKSKELNENTSRIFRNKNNLINQQNNFTKSMISFNKINITNKTNINKSSSMNKIESNYSNIGVFHKIPSLGVTSLSQGKIDKKKDNKNNKNKDKIGNSTFYKVNLNLLQSKKTNNNNNIYIKNNSLVNLLNKGYSNNMFKSFYMNKDNKYNYKIDTNYIKEESKKYSFNSLNDKNIIDEKEEFDDNNNRNIYEYKKKSYSKEKNNYKKLLVPYGSEEYEVYNNKMPKNNNGYGTFYNLNKGKFIFGYKQKSINNSNSNSNINKYNINNSKLPKLYKSISNVTQYNFFGNKSKVKKNNYNYYLKGKNGFNPYNYDYNNKFRLYIS